MIRFLHLPIKAPKGVFLVTKTTSLSHPSFVLSVRLVLAPWRVLSGNDGPVRPAGWDEEEGRAGRGAGLRWIDERWVDVEACGAFGFSFRFDPTESVVVTVVVSISVRPGSDGLGTIL